MKIATIIDLNKARERYRFRYDIKTKPQPVSTTTLSHEQIGEYLDHNIKLNLAKASR